MTELVSQSEALPQPTPANTFNNYTNLHLFASTFFYPPNPPPVTQCPCEAQTAPKQIQDPNKHIRLYYNEPSGYAYNSDCYLIKESRYSTFGGWHSPSDDLVADDAGVGSAVVAAGRWLEKEESDEEAWKTSVYYIDKNGKLRERTNRSFFAPMAHEEFESELPKPEDLVPPTPGWKQTPLQEAELMPKADTLSFPTILPLPTTKLAAACFKDGSIHVFYQAKDESIRELVFDPAEGWFSGQEDESGEVGRVVVGSGEAKPGTPLAVVAGGWMELRLFFVDKADLLKELYSNDHTDWIASEIPSYNVHPTGMLTAVAWNYASAYYQIRLFSTTNSDDLRKFSFSRNDGGWAPEPSVSAEVPETFPGLEAPLSAVSAVVLEGDWVPKVYYHPRRPIIAEWDVCAKTFIYAGITRVGAKALERRMIEEETRVKIHEEEEKKRLEEERVRQEEEERVRQEEEEAKRQEEERVRQEEEERVRKEEEESKRQEEERVRQEEEERVRKEEEEESKRKEELQRQKNNVPQGGTLQVSDPEKAAKLQKHSNCTQGFEWKRVSGGWQCGGGGHYISDADFDAL